MKTKALKAAFPYTIPIFAGFWFLALAYGILMNVNGFSFIYPMLMSLLIYGGSLEFIVVTMLMSPFAPLSACDASGAVETSILRNCHARPVPWHGMEKVLSDLRHVR